MTADGELDRLLEQGWLPQDAALLTRASRQDYADARADGRMADRRADLVGGDIRSPVEKPMTARATYVAPAYAIPLALGEEPVQALQLIRAARPIAAIAYSHDALAWWHLATGTPPAESERQMLAIQRWHRDNWIDVRRIIRQVRREEAGLNG